jgi:multimeric flavodoxin WrbA
MKAVLLDGSLTNDVTGRRVRAALIAQLQDQGWEVEHVALCQQKIGNCAGDFYCWVRTPGMCNVDDDNRAIAEALANSDLAVYLTPVTFGGYSSTLKGMVDHQIQNVSPFFAKVEGEVHHEKRYKKNPDLLAVGWLDAPDAQAETLFRHLVQRNALNWHARTWVSDVVLTSQADEELRASARRWVEQIQDGHASPRVELPVTAEMGHQPVEVRRALLLVGSPKTRKSTSVSLGGYLFEQLEGRAIETETIYLYTVLRSAKKWQALIDALDAADLVMLAFPIYVDTLPAPVTEALERIAAHRQEREAGRRQIFAAIANCGLPEVDHTALGLAVSEAFARQAGFAWAGSLALGSGEIINGVPLIEGGGMTLRIRQALEQAAEALAQGQTIPEEARAMMARPIVPHWLYRVMGWWRTIRWAKGHGATRQLRRRPYLARSTGIQV